MIGLIKSFVDKTLFKNKSRKKFIASRLSLNEIEEKVFLISDKGENDITWEHCIVCHDPFTIAVWDPAGDVSTIQIRKNKKICAEVEVGSATEIVSEAGRVVIYQIVHATCFQLPHWHQYILQKRYFLYKKKDTFTQGMAYAAMYSLPRRVIAVSYKDEHYFNIFPMDFQCFIERSNTLLLGLRTTNTTLRKILGSGKVVVSDTTTVDLKTLYDLGRNHSSAPPSLAELPFAVTESRSFGFYVPDFSASYREFAIVKHVEVGSHTMMIARLVDSERLDNNQSYVHHVHFFEFVDSGYVELS